jgi:transposase
LALALVMEGASRTDAAMACGMDRQTLRDWVHRYNALGIGGLVDRKAPGPPPRLTAQQEAELAQIVEQGPDVADDGIVRWRRVDLRDVIAARFGVALHERTVGKVLDRLGFSHMSVRPRHPKADAEAQEAFKKTSRSWSSASYRMSPRQSRSRSGSRTKHASARKEA